MFGKVWFSLVNQDALKRPLVPLKVAIFQVVFIFEVFVFFEVVVIIEVVFIFRKH